MYLVPPGFMNMTLTRLPVGDNGLPTFEVEIRPPTTGKNTKTGEKTAVRGTSWTFEVYLPVKMANDPEGESRGNPDREEDDDDG